MKDKYLERRHQDLAKCHAALQVRNYDVLATVGHQIKGNALSFGFEGLDRLGATLEDAARNRNSHLLEETLEKMRTYLRQHSEASKG